MSLGEIEKQLKTVGCGFRWWGRAEVRELCNILSPGEVIAQCLNGRYENGFAVFCATDNRLLIVDKKPMFLRLEDIRYDMIAELDFSSQVLESTVTIKSPGRDLVFSSLNHGRLRKLFAYTQQRVTDIRQSYSKRQFQPAMYSGASTAPAVGGLALRDNRLLSPVNPYLIVPTIVSHRRAPRFY